jgi:hypothetical protein
MRKIMLILLMAVLGSFASLESAGWDGSQIYANCKGTAGNEFTLFLYFWDNSDSSWHLQSQGNYKYDADGNGKERWDTSGSGKAYCKVMDEDGVTKSEEFTFGKPSGSAGAGQRNRNFSY